MHKFSFSLPLAFCVYIAHTSSNDHAVVSALAMPDSRRAFLNRAASITTGATMGWVLQQNNDAHPGGCACGQCGGALQQQHSAGCNCGMCNSSANSHVAGCQCGSCVSSSHDAGCTCGSCVASSSAHDAGCGCGMCTSGHDAGCGCGQCGGGLASLGFRPQSAFAYEKRVIGGDNRSATTAAFNIQSEKTYERLEKSGFPLDTSADEKARLSDALSSYSYSTPTSGGKKTNDKAKK